MTATDRQSAQQWIERLGMARHPEGGWFVETYRAAGMIPAGAVDDRGARCFCTAILFLLERGDFSALHRLRGDELWHFHAGAPLTVHTIDPQGGHGSLLLGGDALQGQRFQGVVPAGHWFGAESAGPFSLVGCTVAPGFEFDDFEMARRDRLAALFPQHAGLIARLARN